MAQSSLFWTTGAAGDGAAPYTQAQVTAWLRRMFCADPATQGVVRGFPATGGRELAATASGTTVTIAPGAALVAGFPYESDAGEPFALPTPTLGPTGHRIVLRADYTARTVRLGLKSSANGVASLPGLTQAANTTWEIPVWAAVVTTAGVVTLTDERSFLQHNTNHVRRDGDTMTGALAVPALTVGGLAPWTAANDGQGSGLDADLLAGVQIEPIQRQGGSASSWAAAGTTNYAPSSMRVQAGCVAITVPSGFAEGIVTVAFPVAFAQQPLVICAINGISSYVGAGGAISTIAASSNGTTTPAATVNLSVRGTVTTTSNLTTTVAWIAIGPA